MTSGIGGVGPGGPAPDAGKARDAARSDQSAPESGARFAEKLSEVTGRSADATPPAGATAHARIAEVVERGRAAGLGSEELLNEAVKSELRHAFGPGLTEAGLASVRDAVARTTPLAELFSRLMTRL